MQPETQSITPQNEDTTYALAIHGETVFRACQSGLYRTDDHGKTWHNLYKSWMPEETIPTLAVQLSPNFTDDQTILAGVNGGIVLSTDGGDTWQAYHFRNPLPMVTGIALSPDFSNDGVVLAGTYEDGMFLSSHHGGHWQAFNFGLLDHNILCVATSPNFANDELVYIGTGTGLFRSRNGGRLWEDVPLPIGYDAILSISFSPHFADDGIIFAGSESSGLLQSTDAGNTWMTQYSIDGAINTLLHSSDGKLIMHLDDTVIYSEDFETWTACIEEGVDTVALMQGTIIVVALANSQIKMMNL